MLDEVKLIVKVEDLLGKTNAEKEKILLESLRAQIISYEERRDKLLANVTKLNETIAKLKEKLP